jgi:hypothetical protein
MSRALPLPLRDEVTGRDFEIDFGPRDEGPAAG